MCQTPGSPKPRPALENQTAMEVTVSCWCCRSLNFDLRPFVGSFTCRRKKELIWRTCLKSFHWKLVRQVRQIPGDAGAGLGEDDETEGRRG